MFSGISQVIKKLSKKPSLELKVGLKKRDNLLQYGKISEGFIFMKNNSGRQLKIKSFEVYLEFIAWKNANLSVDKKRYNEIFVPAEIVLLPGDEKNISFYFPLNKLGEISELSAFSLSQITNGKHFLGLRGILYNGNAHESVSKQIKISVDN